MFVPIVGYTVPGKGKKNFSLKFDIPDYSKEVLSMPGDTLVKYTISLKNWKLSNLTFSLEALSVIIEVISVKCVHPIMDHFF